MKLVRWGLTTILSAAMLMSMVSCGGGGDNSSSEGASGDSTSSQLELKNKKMSFMAHWGLNPAEGQPESPTLKMFKEKYGGEVEDRVTTWDERLDAVTAAAMSDDCPDLTVYWGELLPKGFSNGLYREIDDLVDLNGFGWKDTKVVADRYMFNGKHYVCTPYVADGGVLFYNKATIKEYNLEDPRELFRKGEWTWDKMLEMMKTFSDPNDTDGDKLGRYGIDGWDPGDSMYHTCGVPLVTMDENGKLQNNIDDPAIERAMNWVLEFRKQNVGFPRWDNEWNIAPERIKSGKTLFYINGLWEYNRFTIGDLAIGENACFVPYPRDPNADAYYRIAGIDAYMPFGGAKNTEAVSAWLDCHLMVNRDEELRKETDELRVSTNAEEGGLGWNEDDVTFFYEMTDLDTFTPVANDWSGGLGVAGATGHDVISRVWYDSTPWATVREQYKPMLDDAIETFEASL